MARLSFRCPEDMVAAVDEARGLVPREAWLRGMIAGILDGLAMTRDSLDRQSVWGMPVQTDEQPRTRTAEEAAAQMRATIKGDLRPPRVRSSSEARPFRPAPKGKQ